MAATDTRMSRARFGLIIAVLLLIALLVGLAAVFLTLIQPRSITPSGQTGDTDLEWVRSLYGFGPAQDEQLRSPTSVAFAPNGDVYATDPGRARVMIFRSDGSFKRLLHTGAGGTAKGQFARPEAIDVDDEGTVYIADPASKKVIAFDSALQFVREYPADTQPRGVWVTSNRVFILDLGKVLIYEKDGRRSGEFGTRGAAPGQIEAYQGIAATDDRIYIADSFNKRLQAFDTSGQLVWAAPSGVASRNASAPMTQGAPATAPAEGLQGYEWQLPQDLTFDSKGQLVVADAFNFELAVVDPADGRVLASFGDYGTTDGEFYYPTSVDYDATRDWFAVADTANNRIQIVRMPGSGDSASGGLRRTISSPYRYLLVLGVLLLVALAIAALVAWRSIRGMRLAAESPQEELGGLTDSGPEALDEAGNLKEDDSE